MKKIAFIINVFRENNFHSGGEKLFYELVKNSLKDGYTVDLYCCKYLTTKEEPELKLNKLTVMGNAKDYKYPKKIEALFEKYKKLMFIEDYDHIIAENITPHCDKVVLQGHSQLHYTKMAGNAIQRALYTIKKQEFINHQKKWFKQGYNKIFVPSKTLQNELMENFDVAENKFIIAYPGVEIPKESKEIDYENITNKKRPLVVGLSAPSFDKKGGYIFLKALKILKSRGYEVKSKIIYAKIRKNLQLQLLLKLYDLDNNIEFLPYQADMTEFYRSVDCIVMPSLMETFGMVATEAMANKRIPIIGSFCGASEIIKDNENGFVFDMKEKPELNLANKLEILYKNPEKIKEIADNAYNTAISLSWNKAYKTFIDNL